MVGRCGVARTGDEAMSTNPLGLPDDVYKGLQPVGAAEPVDTRCDRCAGLYLQVKKEGYTPRLCDKCSREKREWDEYCTQAMDRIGTLALEPSYIGKQDANDLYDDLAWEWK